MDESLPNVISGYNYWGKALYVDGNEADEAQPNSTGQALKYSKNPLSQGRIGASGSNSWTWGSYSLDLGNGNSIYNGTHVIPSSQKTTFLIRY